MNIANVESMYLPNRYLTCTGIIESVLITMLPQKCFPENVFFFVIEYRMLLQVRDFNTSCQIL